jgi:hypothetical protein
MELKGFPFPPTFDESWPMAYLYGYSDESGKEHDSPIVVFTTLVDKFENWRRFGDTWAALLRRFELKEFHANEAFRCSRRYGTMQPGTPEDRAKDILPFVRAIAEGIEMAAIASIDVAAYKSSRHQECGIRCIKTLTTSRSL